MDRLGIDSTFVRATPHRRSGLCLSFIEDGERVLLTNPGANLEVDSFIRREFDALVDYLSRARAVHVTSFLDRESSTQVARLLTTVKRESPHVVLSVDPGHVWAADLVPPVRELLGAADFIFCNRRELKLLGGHERGDTDDTLARRVFDRINATVTLMVVKRYDLVQVFREGDTQLVVVTSPSSSVRPFDSDIEDATGAGDSFAAGVLAALTSPTLAADLGALMGLALSRYKRTGALGAAPLAPQLDGGLLLFPGITDVVAAPPSGVLLVAGSSPESPESAEIHRFLRDDCGLTVTTVDGATDRFVDSCGFAVCVLVDDEGRPEVTAANQRVVQLAGRFHGRYGFERVAMVVEEGCDVLSNVAGVIRLDYTRGCIERVFWQLKQMLRREGLL